MFKALDISTAGMVAQRVRLNTVANNLANIDTVQTPEGGPYRRRSVVFAEGMDNRDRSGQGVHVKRVDKEDVFRWEYNPSHPYANEQGYVKLPGIDRVVEMVNGMEASRAYEANVTASEVSKAMIQGALRLLA